VPLEASLRRISRFAPSLFALFLLFLGLVVGVGALAGRAAFAGDTAAAEKAVLAAESDPSKAAAAKTAVADAVAADPQAVAPRLLEARVLAVEAKGKKTAQRAAAYALVFDALTKASALDPWDPAPFRLKADVMTVMGTPDNAAYTEALRAAAIRSPGDTSAREAYTRHTGKVPQVVQGDPLPRVVWKDAAGKDVTAASLFEKGPVVVELYRSAVWCPFCQKQLVVLHDNVDKLAKEGLAVVACSPDTGATIAKVESDGLKDRKPYRVRLLADPEGKTADKLGLLNPETVKPGTAPDAFGLPFPTTIIVDGRGIVRFVKTHGDHRDRVKPEEMIAVAKKIRADATPPK